MPIRYTWNLKVLVVEERKKVITTQKEEDGSIATIVDPTGWWVVTEDNIAHGLGFDKPDIAKGDTVRMTMEKIT